MGCRDRREGEVSAACVVVVGRRHAVGIAGDSPARAGRLLVSLFLVCSPSFSLLCVCVCLAGIFVWNKGVKSHLDS